MTDVALNWGIYGADIAIENGDLVEDKGLFTAVLIALFSDARAPDFDSLPDPNSTLKGWWGDFENEDNTGSLLWLISREKLTNETAARAFEYVRDCLQFLKDDEIAETIEIETQIEKPDSLYIGLKIYRGNTQKFSYLWEGEKEQEILSIQNARLQIQFI